MADHGRRVNSPHHTDDTQDDIMIDIQHSGYIFVRCARVPHIDDQFVTPLVPSPDAQGILSRAHDSFRQKAVEFGEQIEQLSNQLLCSVALGL